MHRYRFVLSRPFQLIPVLLGISLVTFVLVRSIPGDPARLILGTRATPQALERVRAQFGLDEPLWLQYLYFLRNLGRGEMGRSILYKVDVLGLILQRLEPTLVLVAGSVVLSLSSACRSPRSPRGGRARPPTAACGSPRRSASACRTSGWRSC